ncbi:MAG: hypothetical protein CPDRYMAC_2689 [uncultured Paraburkholderia sp.]|nr:MAG: hypothetical protein CPDRYDRY_3249 [uncultured Paraburkholderia sp.]CAH2926716.1 MAG: hypothetical protein CPDRYMAC_2689 [uncultured Paraburkholderia sp.]
MRKLLITLCTLLTCLHLTNAFAAEAEAPAAGRAFLDAVAVASTTHTMQLVVWAVVPGGKVGVPTLHVFVDQQEVYVGTAQQQVRPDVAKATGHAEWANAGWVASVPLPASVGPGTDSLLVRVQFGAYVCMDSRPSSPQNASISIPEPKSFTREIWGVLLSFAVVLGSYFFAPLLSRTLSRVTGRAVAPQASPVLGLLICFALFVGFGVSGTSVHETEGASLPIQGIRTTVIAGESRPIRSDEWLVLSTMAIGQVRADPAFPVVNKDVGPDGQNMLVVGMTSVPVLDVSALGRPATWGYFFLPLPQAMAWHWWFPAFACVLGLWACLSLLLPGRWRTTLVLSLCFVLSPYVVAWSYWPAYVTLFAATAFVAVVTLLKDGNRLLKPLLAAVVGISAGGFALTLYPAWQVPLAYLFALLLVGVAVRDWRSLRFSVGNIAWLVLGLVLAGVIVGSWWLHARDAVAAMVVTIYPGQRTAVPGGGIEPWYMARGFTNFRTLYSDLQGFTNQSEVSSFLYFFVPALVGAVFNRAHSGRNKPVFYAILAFMALTFWYQYIGFPVALAKLTQWGRSFPTRADIALGVASFALLGLALAKEGGEARESHPLPLERIGACIAAAVWVAILYWSMREMPGPIAGLMDRPRMVLMLVVIGWCSYALASRWSGAFLASLLALLLFTTAAFNPWTVITASAQPKPAVGSCAMGDGRTLVLGSHVPAMTLMASGCEVLDGVSYYPQMSLWHKLDPGGQQSQVYNRYMHLLVDVGDLHGSPAAQIMTPQSDVVRMTLDPKGFDFVQLPIAYVLVRADIAAALESNPSLQKMTPLSAVWSRFKVVRKDANGQS